MKNAIASAVFLYQKDKKLLFTTSTTFVVQGFDIFHRHKIACNDVNDKNKTTRTTNVRKNENSCINNFFCIRYDKDHSSLSAIII